MIETGLDHQACVVGLPKPGATNTERRRRSHRETPQEQQAQRQPRRPRKGECDGTEGRPVQNGGPGGGSYSEALPLALPPPTAAVGAQQEGTGL